MDIIVSMLVAVHVIVCLLLVVIVLMQRPKQEGLGAAFGGGMTDQMFGAQTTDVLQKGTVWLSVMFFVITMVLAILVSKQNSASTGLGESLGTSAAPAAAEGSGLPQLPKGEETLTTAPAALTDDAKAAAKEVKAAATEEAGEAKAAATDAAATVKDAAKAKAKAGDGAKATDEAAKPKAKEAAKDGGAKPKPKPKPAAEAESSGSAQ